MQANRRLLAAVIIGLTSLAGFTGVLPVFRDALQGYYGLSNARFGILATFGSLAGAAGALAGGALTDRWGAWRVFRLFLFLVAGGSALGAVPGGWGLMLASLGLVNFGFYGVATAAQAVLVTLFPSGRRRILSAYLVVSALVSMVLPLVWEGLLREVKTGSLPFAGALHGSFGVACLLMAAGGWWCSRRRGALAPEGAAEHHAGGAVVAGLWLLVALATLHCTFDMMSAVWIPRILTGPSYARQWVLPGLVVALFSLMYAVSRALLGLMPENKWRRRLKIVPGMAGGAVLLAGLLTGSQLGAAIGYVLGGFCWSLEYPAFLSAMAGDRRFGRAMAAINVASGVTCFALPTAQGFVVDRLHAAGRGDLEWTVLLAPAAGFMLVGLLGAAWVRRYGRHL